MPRPQHEYQQPGVVEVFRQHFPTRMQGVVTEIKKQWGGEVPITYWCQDETRLGFRTDLSAKEYLPIVYFNQLKN